MITSKYLGRLLPSYTQQMSASAVFLGLLLIGMGNLRVLAVTNDYYVTVSGAGNHDGTSWSHAWTMAELNSSWGSVGPGTVWLAGGNYGTQLRIQASGSSGDWIYIKRVLSTDYTPTHASGWNPSYDTQVVIDNGGSPIGWYYDNVGNYVEIDGRVDAGIKAVTSDVDLEPASVDIAAQVHHVAIKYVDMAGPAGSSAQTWTYNPRSFAARKSANGDWQVITNLTVSHCRLHGTVTLAYIFNVQDSLFEYSKFYDCNAANPTNGIGHHPNLSECGGGSKNNTWKYNEFWNWAAEGLMIHQQTGGVHYIYGNVWHDSVGGAGRCIESNGQDEYHLRPPMETTVLFYNNTIFNVDQGFNVTDNGVFSSSSAATNNIFWDVGAHGLGNLSHHDFNASDVNLSEANDVLLTIDPFVDSANDDYHIVGTIASNYPRNKGAALSSTYNMDMDGLTRGADGYWDIGAFEFAYPNAHLVNVQYSGDAPYPFPYVKTGPEAVGVYAADFWNLDYDGSGVYGALDFAGNSTSIDVTSTGEGDSIYVSADNLWNGYTLNKGGGDIQIAVSVPAGTYTLVVYNGAPNSMTFTLSVGEDELASDSVTAGYVAFEGYTMESSGTFVINCHSSTQAYVNGLQIMW